MAFSDGFHKFLIMMYKGLLFRYIVTAIEIIIPLVIASVAAIITSLQQPDWRRPPDTYYSKRNATFYDPYDPFDSTFYAPRQIFLLYTPKDGYGKMLIENAKERCSKHYPYTKFKLTGYDSEEELVQHSLQMSSEYLVVGTVLKNFHNNDIKIPQSLDYKIRYRSSYSYSDIFYLDIKYSYSTYANTNGYRQSFFLPWQAAVEQAFIDMRTGKSEMKKDYKVMLNRFPFPPIDSPGFGFSPLELIAMFISYGFIAFLCVLVKRIVVEKANHSKELLKMMGLTDCAYWTSTFFNSFAFGAIIMFAITIMYKSTLSNSMMVFTYIDFGLILIILLLYLASFILFCLAMTTLFNRSNIAVCVTLLLHVLSEILLFVFVFLPDPTITTFAILTPFQKYSICLIPNGALHLAFKMLSTFEITGDYEGWSSISK